MDRDLLRLKLILNQHCTELQNLTISDLQDLKWLTKQKLILSLVSKSPLFTDQCEEIERILEQRNKDVLLLKSKNVSREQKMENDTVYRTCILRVLLNCAEILKWPKALEAFSNPLQDIMTDNSLFLDCIQYCIQILFDNMPKRQHLTSSATEVISSPLLSKRNNPKSPIVKYSQDVSETTIHHDNEICLDKEEDFGSCIGVPMELGTGYSRQERNQIQILSSQNRQLLRELRTMKEALSKRRLLETKFRSAAQEVVTAVEEISSIASKDTSQHEKKVQIGKEKTGINTDRPWQLLHSRLVTIFRQLDECSSSNINSTGKDFEPFTNGNISRKSYQMLANKSGLIELPDPGIYTRLHHLLQLTGEVIDRAEHDELYHSCVDLNRCLLRITNGSSEDEVAKSNSALFLAVEKSFQLSGLMKLTKEKRDAVEEICIQALKEADTLHRKMYLLEKLSSNVRKDLKPKRVFVPDKVTSLQKDTDTECIDSVLETYEIANRSRLITNSKQVRDPIEMLSRGYMGSDVANFINTFKANIDGLKSFSLSQR